MGPARDNISLLTSGSRTYEKKKKLNAKRPELIEFDEDSRRDFVTGFRKRKLERQKKFQEKMKETLRLEKVEERKQRKQDHEEKLKQVQEMNRIAYGGVANNSDASESDEESLQSMHPPDDTQVQVKTEKKAQQLISVTTITDFDIHEENNGLLKEVKEDQKYELTVKDTVVKKQQQPSQETSFKKPKPKKFRYESKRERKKAELKVKAKKRKQASMR